MRILLVEDDPLLGDALRAGLGQAGFDVDWVRDGQAALAALTDGEHAAAVLDLGLPRLSGFDVLARVRGAGVRVPVLVLTARDAIDDRVRGLDAGADDYVVKPFHLGELRARLLVGTRIVALQQDLSEKVAELTAALDTVRILESDFGARPQPPRSDERAPVTLPDPRARGANDAVNSR